MSRPSAQILLVGRESLLLETRSQVLRLAGFDVYEVLNLNDASRLLAQLPIDLLILCHTLSIDERDRVLNLADSLRPKMKQLLLEGTEDDHKAFAGRAEIFAPFQSPRNLLAKSAEMLGLSMRSLESGKKIVG